jgi:hypothetical protein
MSSWFQIIVSDPAALSGTSVALFARSICERLGITHVGIRDVVGSVTGLKNLNDTVVSVADFISKVGEATQYDWALFFLYGALPSEAEWTIKNDRERITQTVATIRLADDTYFYVYTQDSGLAFYLKSVTPQAEVKALGMSDLEIPY